jgi:hypothetical protein
MHVGLIPVAALHPHYIRDLRSYSIHIMLITVITVYWITGYKNIRPKPIIRLGTFLVGRRKAQQALGTGNFDGDGPQGVWEEPLGRCVSHRVCGRCAEGLCVRGCACRHTASWHQSALSCLQAGATLTQKISR